jgi:threonine/homoserine/homoserine lactone efflux protein
MSVLLPIATFTFVMSITPGPNNILLWASGANFGLRRTLPHLLGVNLGFASLLLLIGLGLGAVFEALPALQLALKIVGSLYLLYLAYRLATASFSGGGESGRPFTFLEAAGFQYANPKAWVFGLTLMSAFALPEGGLLLGVALATLVVMVVNLPCIGVWVLFGSAIGRFLRHPRALLVFNLAMAGLLVATILLIV